MKKLFFSFTLFTALLMGCKSAPAAAVAAADSPSVFGEVVGKNWKLIEVHINKNNSLNKYVITREGMEEIFTLKFDEQNIAGVGAPNRYSAPYTIGEDSAISIMTVRATLMASIREPEQLREHDYFNYVQNTYRWNLVDTNLELYSKTEDGSEIVLIFEI